MIIQIPVTVSVTTYNSSKYVLATLESIKAQTYQPLILHICDDCSTDNTLRICESWIKRNKSRFVETKIIVAERNTGVAGNVNRCLTACETEWCKNVAGDDVLRPECVEEYVKYVTKHPETVIVYSRVGVLGSTKERMERILKYYDYDFFKMSFEEQYESLVVKGNTVPSVTQFLNVKRLRELDIKYDERIPLLEDYPFLLNLIKNKVKLSFLDKVLVGYRVGCGGLSSGGNLSINYRKSLRLFYFYYLFPEKYRENPEKEINDIIKYELDILQDLQRIQNSPSFKLGDVLLRPIKWFLRR